jgi:dihydroorotate dehydrogenase
MYKFLIRPLLFCLNPESAHHLVFSTLRFIFRIPGVAWISRQLFSWNRPELGRKIMGLYFPNPVGLAAGFDKDALLYKELANFGFGFIEVGTLTPKAQPGNPKPRMFRLPADRGLINRMGFNNHGVAQAAIRLQSRPSNLIIGGNIGKNKDTPNEKAVDDYLTCFKELYPVVDYFVVNVSSPNTPNLRALQEKEPLTILLNAVMQLNTQMPAAKPVLLKIAPDLSDTQLDEILEIVSDCSLQGIIATNTTISRDHLVSPSAIVSEAGGLSGAPVRERSTEVIRYLRKNGRSGLVIIGVGGIFNAEDAQEKLDAGADLVQVYTGFIYEGPGMIRKILQKLTSK